MVLTRWVYQKSVIDFTQTGLVVTRGTKPVKLSFVMPGVVPGIHVFLRHKSRRGWPGRAGTSPAMTAKGSPLTMFRQSALVEHVDHPLPDRRLGGLKRRRHAEGHHQRPHGAAMGDSDGVDEKGIEPL